MRNEIFEKIFEMAKIAQMNRNEVNRYLKSLNDMNIVRNEIKRRDRALAEARAERDDARNSLAAMEKENAELRRRLGLN